MEKVFLGIDVAKNEIEVFLKAGKQGFGGTFDNNQAGFNRLNNWLTKKKGQRPCRPCLYGSNG